MKPDVITPRTLPVDRAIRHGGVGAGEHDVALGVNDTARAGTVHDERRRCPPGRRGDAAREVNDRAGELVVGKAVPRGAGVHAVVDGDLDGRRVKRNPRVLSAGDLPSMQRIG